MKIRLGFMILLSVFVALCSCAEPPEPTVETCTANVVTETECESEMNKNEFSALKNVEITGADLAALDEEEKSVLLAQAKYCQAMTDADIETLRSLVAEDTVFTHMSGKQQTREEYFDDIARGRLRYFSIGIENPVIEVNGDRATVSFTSVLNANAYGARGAFRMRGVHAWEKRNGAWISVNR